MLNPLRFLGRMAEPFYARRLVVHDFAHPLMEAVFLLGFERLAHAIHEGSLLPADRAEPEKVPCVLRTAIRDYTRGEFTFHNTVGHLRRRCAGSDRTPTGHDGPGTRR